MLGQLTSIIDQLLKCGPQLSTTTPAVSDYSTEEKANTPSKLYQAAEEILVVTPGYKNPKLKVGRIQLYIETFGLQVKSVGHSPPPAGYDYKAPDGYSPAENPTFPDPLYKPPTKKKNPKKSKILPAGYDYKAPEGYSPADNPTFPSALYKPPTKKNKSKVLPTGYDYKAPVGYKPGENPTFPKKLYEPPEPENLYEPPKPDKSYLPPTKSYLPPEQSYTGPEPGSDYLAPGDSYQPPDKVRQRHPAR